MVRECLAEGAGTRQPCCKGGTFAVRLEPIAQAKDLEGAWRGLERRSDASFFQSWAWIGCWLRNLPSRLSPRVLTIAADGEIVGLGIIVASQERRHRWLLSHVIHLNETGDDRFDAIAIEHNGVLLDREVDAFSVLRCALRWLTDQESDWDELKVAGVGAAAADMLATSARECRLGVRAHAEERRDYVDLAALRGSGGDYLGRLSRNTRAQIRRARRLYEQAGPLSLTIARTAREALDFLECLREMHQAAWAKRGQVGAFSNAFYNEFHQDLVASQFSAGSIQLLRIAAGERAIGYLYNFAKDGKVHAYQSGFLFDPDPRLKPGLVSHELAIEYNLRAGASEYDFMAGESQYKTSLGTHCDDMLWLVVYRMRAKLRFENALRSGKRLMTVLAQRLPMRHGTEETQRRPHGEGRGDRQGAALASRFPVGTGR